MFQKGRKKNMFANVSYHVALLCWSVPWDVFWILDYFVGLKYMGAQNGQWK